ncbi:ribulokinase [Paenibacillus naphthalenovorans]|uniref:ribulokinase n=1 Tax=Paenibacillus naphthalenovorans TaxID=162209 RepID=UPI00088FE00F|nr:ribulokinase [Paenibacillus naphthalenovorans]SDI35477.1 L-ribulokinase [Paenibacillus naphthalenovorans]
MNTPTCSLGIDFGTESGRAVLVDVSNGEVLASHVTPYAHGVITERLPHAESNSFVPPDWALQHPQDYLEVLYRSIPAVLQAAGVSAEQVIGLGIDFTSCTMLPVDAAFEPLCLKAEYSNHPHAWVKLWKHHSTQEETDLLNRITLERNEPWLKRYGGKISSEWMLPKCLQILHEAPEIYRDAAYFIEAGDWIVAKLIGQLKRSGCMAGFKSFWHEAEGYPAPDFFAAVDPRLQSITDTKLSGEVVPLGNQAGTLLPHMAARLGLTPDLPVAISMIDAHAAVLGTGVCTPGKLVMVMGTSTCHLMLSEKEICVPGISGVVKDSIIPGLYGYEAGQSAVGDIFAWFMKQGIPVQIIEEAAKAQMSVQDWMERLASELKPGESGILALDWHNGNRSPLDDAELTGAIFGMTLRTRPHEIYRALLEATAFGARSIMETFRNNELPVHELYAAGGIPQRNRLLMQIYSDVMNMEIKVADSPFTPAIGAAILGSVAAGEARGGYKTIQDATAVMGKTKSGVFKPIPEHVSIYEALYKEYSTLKTYFGEGGNDVLKRLKRMK